MMSGFVSLRRGLPHALASALEAHFESDLARVRIGLDASVEGRGAIAFAHGDTIHIAPRAYRPDSAWGQRLLAHELTHIVQQRDGRVLGAGWVVNAELEAEAEREALRFEARAASSLPPPRSRVRRRDPASVAQPRVKILHRSGNWINAVVSAVSAVHEQSGSRRRLSRDDIVFALMEIDLSPVDYGLVDLDDSQQVELFYYQILRAAVGFQVRFHAPGSEALTRSRGSEKTELGASDAMKEDEAKLRKEIEKERQKLGKAYYTRIIAGAGSSASYYLNTLGETFDHRGTLLIGPADAWTPAERGKGLVNHEAQNIAQWGRDAPKFTREYMDREEFAKQSLDIRVRALVNGMRHEWSSVDSIALSRTGDAYFDVQAGGKTYTTNRVVVCLGAGPHVHPGKLDGFTIMGKPKRLIDLDTFMRKFPPEATGQTGIVVVHGPNAGIDAVERARAVGFHVLWFIRSTQPVLLKGNRLDHAPWTKTINVDDVRIGPESSSGVAIKARFNKQEVKLDATEVDYYVYALGQDPFAKGAVGDVLDPVILEHLEPVEDPNQSYQTYGVALPKDSQKDKPERGTTADASFRPSEIPRNPKGDPSHQSKSIAAFVKDTDADFLKPETYKDRSEAFRDLNVVVGLQFAGSSRAGGLWVLGAAAFQLVFEPQGYKDKANLAPYGRVAKDYKERVGKETNRPIDNKILVQAMMGQTRFEVRSVVISPQLGTVKSSIGAMHAMMPSYISREANFSQDNPTMLRVFIASKYPNIDLKRVDEIIAAILVHRRFDYHPLGYDAWWQVHWRHVLEYWNEKPEGRAAVEKRQREELRQLQSKVDGAPGTQMFKG